MIDDNTYTSPNPIFYFDHNFKTMLHTKEILTKMETREINISYKNKKSIVDVNVDFKNGFL